MSFSDFNLNKDFIQAIEAAGYTSPTDLQAQLIPLVEQKKSALIWSQSASGKTGAFLIPAMNYILENPAPEKRGARILILTSRRDRVSQINYTIKRLSNDLTMRFGFIVSGRPYQTQMRLMRRPLDIMIATPGRLNDLMNNGKADFSQLEMLIIDDLSSIYRKNLQGLVESILKQAGEDCSAITFVSEDDEIKPYAEGLFPNAEQITLDEDDEGDEFENEAPQDQHHAQANPKTVSKNNDQANKDHHQDTQGNNDNNKPETKNINIEDLMPQKVHIADDYTHKIAMMDHLMDEFAGESTIIYTATNKAAKTLQDNLSNHGHAAELVDDVSSDELSDCDIIIYSDQSKANIDNELMAKLDTNIINFDLPHNIDHYLERLNRHNEKRENATLLMLDGYNFNELKALEKALGEKLEQVTIPGLEALKPFVNLSKGRPNKRNSNTNNRGKKPNNANQKRQGGRNNNGAAKKKGPNNQNANTNKNAKNDKNKNTRRKPNAKGRSKNNTGQAQEGDGAQRRQHKGPFGRLNGGTHRKSNARKVGVSRVGTDAPKGREGKSLAAEVKERSADSGKTVKISYNKKRTLSIKKPEEL